MHIWFPKCIAIFSLRSLRLWYSSLIVMILSLKRSQPRTPPNVRKWKVSSANLQGKGLWLVCCCRRHTKKRNAHLLDDFCCLAAIRINQTNLLVTEFPHFSISWFTREKKILLNLVLDCCSVSHILLLNAVSAHRRTGISTESEGLYFPSNSPVVHYSSLSI